MTNLASLLLDHPFGDDEPLVFGTSVVVDEAGGRRAGVGVGGRAA